MNIVTEIEKMRSDLERLQQRIDGRQQHYITDDDPVKARMTGRKVELERAIGVIEPMQAEVERLQRELTHLQIEVTNLRGLKPEIPPMPGEDWPKELPRYILRENGPRRPRSVPYKDGYWTPWYLANRLHEELERERKAAKTACENWGEMKQERDQLAAQLELERLKADAAGDLEYANGAKRGFEWGQHDDNASLAACIESRAPESVRTLKEIRQQAKEVQS